MSDCRSAAKKKLPCVALGAAVACAGPAWATVYTDTVGMAEHFSDSWVDIANVEVTNTAANLTFVINLNPLMNDGTTPNNIQNDNFTNYDIGFDTVAGGSTTLQGAFDQVMGLSTGMDFWLRSWANGNAAPSTLGGYLLFKWDGASWGSAIVTDATVAITPTSSTITIPLASLELSTGNEFHFDVWTTFSQGAQGAYDALANPNQTPGLPFASGMDPPTPYDGASGANYAATVYTVVAGAVSGSWTGAANANWSDAGNWTGGVPNSVDAAATFGASPSVFSVLVDANQTVGAINFDSATSYTIAGGFNITMDVSSGNAAINVTAGTHNMSAPVVLNDNLTITTAASTGVMFAEALGSAGRTVTKAGAGSVQFENIRAAALAVTGGVVRMRAKLTPNAPQGTTVVQSLSISPGALLDLGNNSAIIDYTGPVGTLVDDVRQHLANGRLTTTSTTALIGLGYADNAVLNSVKTSFGGQTVDASSLLIKFTYLGDTDLDGDVDVADLGTMATNWQTANVWSGGDFDYNGTVNVNDLGLLATNWQAGVGSPLGPDFASAAAALGLPASAVPEPASIGLILLMPWSLKRPGRARHRRFAPR